MILPVPKRLGGIISLITQLLVFVIWLAIAGEFVKIVREHYRTGNDDPVWLAIFMLSWEIAGACGTAFWFFRQFAHADANRRLLAFLESNADKLRNNEKVFYRCKVITLKTVLVRHHLVCSAMILSGRMTTRWLVKGQEPRLRHALGASLYSFWNGWWGIPFGLIWTPMAVIRNIAGETTTTVEDLIRVPPPPFTSVGQRVAHEMKKDLKELVMAD